VTTTDSNTSTTEFNFDRWVELAKADPAAFEAWRSAWIEEAIASAPPDCRQRMRGLQFRIDLERRRARTPLKACIRLSQMMWQSVMGENGLMDALNGLGQGARVPARTTVGLSARRIGATRRLTPDA
jgi:hypothetical protein